MHHTQKAQKKKQTQHLSDDKPSLTHLVHKHQLSILFIPRMTLDPLPPSIQDVATSGRNYRNGGCFVVVTDVVCIVLIHGFVKMISFMQNQLMMTLSIDC